MGLLDGINQNTYYTTTASYGNYQFTSLEHIINAFMVAYVGESKLISKVNRTDVQFHGMRAIQELSYDVFRSVKSQEIEIPPSLKMILPQDYVNYVKLVRVGNDGIERLLYPTGKTSNPFAITQNTDGTYDFGQQKRVVTVTFSNITGNIGVIGGGSYLTLGYNTSSNTQGFVSFRFETVEFNDYDNPTGEGPVFGIDITTSDTETTTATLLKNAITDFGHHTVTQNGGVLTITYNEDAVNTTTINSTENTYQSTGANQSGNFVSAVVNAGTATGTSLIEQADSDTWTNYQSQGEIAIDNYSDSIIDIQVDNRGRRYGLDPQHAQDNGSFYIDYLKGFIHFSSALAGATITLKYISDGLGTDAEMVVHKFAEEAVYKHIAYGILASRTNIPEYIVARFKKERFAETRKAKIRLSNIKIEEFTQVLKGLSKPIK